MINGDSLQYLHQDLLLNFSGKNIKQTSKSNFYGFTSKCYNGLCTAIEPRIPIWLTEFLMLGNI